MNRVTLFGNVGADPEIRNTQNSKVANIRLATSERWTDRDGNKQERTEWHTLIIWARGNGDGLVGVVDKYVKKGDKLLVEGKLQTRKWQDQDGKDRYSTEILVDQLTMAGSPDRDAGSRKRDDEDDNRPEGRSSNRDRDTRGNGTSSKGTQGGFNALDDDIPFAPEWR